MSRSWDKDKQEFDTDIGAHYDFRTRIHDAKVYRVRLRAIDSTEQSKGNFVESPAMQPHKEHNDVNQAFPTFGNSDDEQDAYDEDNYLGLAEDAVEDDIHKDTMD
ncbi:uncharacterized protein Z519_03724 [Cladophialophora bantiana CBS 173.52]|uniref:Uncharacterized protein n=1 Tax=Cladophialophora bantiana (strain ATCC 10958 / CBS 173.52 / CDC B-1940 / NIH 8579) TaxID=1442370 RepID=A0A0D2HW12_CLAB1|nr:uncharacterized protein Z519_03724 [Cladophialophora bantiana CBS 173.52]KIW95140.1 hypothetical protein Z519_03724 [Cladophialophora bantiana CBS 173.52]